MLFVYFSNLFIDLLLFKSFLEKMEKLVTVSVQSNIIQNFETNNY